MQVCQLIQGYSVQSELTWHSPRYWDLRCSEEDGAVPLRSSSQYDALFPSYMGFLGTCTYPLCSQAYNLCCC